MTSKTHALDRTDHLILSELQNNARLANKELAAIVGLAPSSCLSRVQRLIRSGVLGGFHAQVDPKALGIGLQALVFVRIVRHQRELMERFWDHLREIPEVCDLYYVAGSHDLVVHVAVRDVDHLRTLVAEQFSSRAELGSLETSLIFQHRRRPSLPDYALADAPDSRKHAKKKTRRS
jgi:DNA-binding Lrp family transcriptional regulator